MTQSYPKRLIEVDLPIKRISAHARREKSIRHGHISTLHMWWARRPLGACRAMMCASLWPDPADAHCPQTFRDSSAKIIFAFAQEAARSKELGATADHETWTRWQAMAKTGCLDSRNEAHCNVLRTALLDFIADFANWDNSTVGEYLQTSRALTQAAHEALGGDPGTRPLVVDPFAGGGSIPLEALRVGADAFASDLNPIPILLNTVVLEYIPKYGRVLADEVRKWGAWIKEETEKELAEFYPKGPDSETPIAYLWARTVRCEGPGCGAQIPLLRSLWLSKNSGRQTAIQLIPSTSKKQVSVRIIVKKGKAWSLDGDDNTIIDSPRFDGTVKRGSATCPCCGYTTSVRSVRLQLKQRKGGTDDARLLAVVSVRPDEPGRRYRRPTDEDLQAVSRAKQVLEVTTQTEQAVSSVPTEAISTNELRRISPPLYGMASWGDLFTSRQALCLSFIAARVKELPDAMSGSPISSAIQVLLAMALDRQADYNSSICRWVPAGEFVGNTFGRQAIPMVWDFCEVSPISGSTGSFEGAYTWIANVLERESVALTSPGQVVRASAVEQPLPSDSVDAVITDPPYYDSVPYSHLSDFFYVWLKRSVGPRYPELFSDEVTPKAAEIVVDRPHELSSSTKGIEFYERELTKAFRESWRVIRPEGTAAIVFASKSTASWEAILKAVIDAGWIVTGSWPIDTEMESRIAAKGQARLASSVHLICRPRKNHDGPASEDVGDWRDILQALPNRIHEWMPRLASEGVVGADAIFACLGPALEIFSRYTRVEKASGDIVTLREYLEQVWAAVAKEALTQVFQGADTTGFEPDARLTAMWLWTLSAPGSSGTDEQADDEDEEQEGQVATKSIKGGFRVEYDAARKIAQGLGAALEALPHLVQVKGDEARLLPVSERTRHLFGKDEDEPVHAKGKKASPQINMFAELTEADNPEIAWKEKTVTRIGETTLDRVHQAMILFAAGRGEALKRFVMEDGVGRDGKFWRLAQALSALYPTGTDERRWVEGVMARKKQFGF